MMSVAQLQKLYDLAMLMFTDVVNVDADLAMHASEVRRYCEGELRAAGVELED